MSIQNDMEEIERDVEASLLEGRRQLELGKEEAIHELRAHHHELTRASEQFVRNIEGFTERAEEKMEELQRQLGELSYVLAERDMKSPETFQRMHQNLLRTMQEVRTMIWEMEFEGDPARTESRETFLDAWRRFQQRLELVRFHLARAEEDATTGWEAQRELLRVELEQAARDKRSSSDMVHRMGDETKRTAKDLWPWVLAFFQSPEEAMPRLPHEKGSGQHDPASRVLSGPRAQ